MKNEFFTWAFYYFHLIILNSQVLVAQLDRGKQHSKLIEVYLFSKRLRRTCYGHRTVIVLCVELCLVGDIETLIPFSFLEAYILVDMFSDKNNSSNYFVVSVGLVLSTLPVLSFLILPTTP